MKLVSALSLIALLSLNVGFAEDGSGYTEGSFANGVRSSEKEIRPSFLLNVETAQTIDPQAAVVSIFGTNTRVSYGIMKNLEARADISYKHVSDPNDESYGVGATLKYTVLQHGDFGIGVVASTNKTKALSVNPTSQHAIQVPFTLSTKWMLLTAIPFHKDPVKRSEKNSNGSDFGVAVPVTKWADAIVEWTYTSNSADNDRGTVAGFAFKPTNRVTIPLVLARRNPGQATEVGLVGIFAHVGFQF